MASVEEAVEALLDGRLAILPMDTVYGLAASPWESSTQALYRAKGRDAQQPTALVALDVDVLAECLPELRGRDEAIARALLPGPYTLILGNPGRRWGWLTGSRPETLGVRVPTFSGPGAEVLARVGALVATSANLPGGPDPRTLDEVPAQLRDVAVALDGGELPGTPSTVIDFTGAEPVVVREGAASAHEALRLVGRVL